MRILIVLLFVGLMLSSSFAQATAKMDGCKFKVTIHVAFKGPGATDAFISRVKPAVDAEWNKGFKVGKCGCAFEVEVKTKKVDNCDEAESTDPSYHCIHVYNTRGINRAHVFRTDFTRGLSSDTAKTVSGDGKLEVHDTAKGIAHEFGHLMGLHDEYVDKYKYEVVDADGNKVSGPHFIDNQTWFNTGNTIKAALPQGHRLVFKRNNYGSFFHSVPANDSVNDSLMASISANAKVKQYHVDAIFKQCRFQCPKECCCGNAVVDSSVNESCDYKANPDGCQSGFTCNNKCACEAKPKCGDNKVNGDEECDHTANPDGCKSGEVCSKTCKCKDADDDSQDGNESDGDLDPEPEIPPMFTMTIMNPTDGVEISFPEDVFVEYSDPLMVHSIEYWIDDILVLETEDPGLIWFIEPEFYSPGEHTLEVRAYDLEDNEVIDSVDFEISSE